MLALVRREGSIVVAALAWWAAWPLEHAVVPVGQGTALAASVALIAAILFASVGVAHHAETLNPLRVSARDQSGWRPRRR
jgi:Ca2+:H+ antiporter